MSVADFIACIKSLLPNFSGCYNRYLDVIKPKMLLFAEQLQEIEEKGAIRMYYQISVPVVWVHICFTKFMCRKVLVLSNEN